MYNQLLDICGHRFYTATHSQFFESFGVLFSKAWDGINRDIKTLLVMFERQVYYSITGKLAKRARYFVFKGHIKRCLHSTDRI